MSYQNNIIIKITNLNLLEALMFWNQCLKPFYSEYTDILLFRIIMCAENINYQ